MVRLEYFHLMTIMDLKCLITVSRVSVTPKEMFIYDRVAIGSILEQERVMYQSYTESLVQVCTILTHHTINWM